MASYQALYYPYIHFRDDGWVKLAALYWDKLKRIVPEGYPTEDSATVTALGDFIEIVRPGEVGDQFAKTFGDFFAAHGPKLQASYAVAKRDDWAAVPKEFKPSPAGGPSGTDPRLGYVRREKINDDVLQSMVDLGLASTDERGSDWIGMHPRLAGIYMHALAEDIADSHGLRPLTDQSLDHAALSKLSLERLAQVLLGDVQLVDAKPTAGEHEALAVSIAFQTLVPTDLHRLSIDKIQSFRAAHREERHRFQAAAAGLLEKNKAWIVKMGDPALLAERLRDEVDKQWADELKQLRKRLTSVGIDTMLSSATLSVSLPPMLAGASTLLGLAPGGLAVSGTAVALAAIPMLRSKRKAAADELAKSSLAYLYRMEQDLVPKTLLARCGQDLRRFALGV